MALGEDIRFAAKATHSEGNFRQNPNRVILYLFGVSVVKPMREFHPESGIPRRGRSH